MACVVNFNLLSFLSIRTGYFPFENADMDSFLVVLACLGLELLSQTSVVVKLPLFQWCYRFIFICEREREREIYKYIVLAGHNDSGNV